MEALPARVPLQPRLRPDEHQQELLRELPHAGSSGALWLNGDVVFDPQLFEALASVVAAHHSAVRVNTVGEGEVKYGVDPEGLVAELFKAVRFGLGEAVGINFVARQDVPVLLRQLEACDAQDYFERGIERTIYEDGLRVKPVDISRWPCLDIKFQDELHRANARW